MALRWSPPKSVPYSNQCGSTACCPLESTEVRSNCCTICCTFGQSAGRGPRAKEMRPSTKASPSSIRVPRSSRQLELILNDDSLGRFTSSSNVFNRAYGHVAVREYRPKLELAAHCFDVRPQCRDE